MPTQSKGLYAPRLVDGAFAFMAAGSVFIIANAPALPVPEAATTTGMTSGFILLATVALVGLASCLVHAIDRKGWDDYMRQIVTQSALIGMITVFLTGAAWDTFISPNLGYARPGNFTLGMIPIAALSWSIGYFWLRIRGTNT